MRTGYDSGFSVAITACSSTLGVIIPPSVLLVVYEPCERRFHRRTVCAGFVPGFLIAFAQCMYTYYYMAIKHNLLPQEGRYMKSGAGSSRSPSVIFLP